MRAVIQKVLKSAVSVDSKVVGRIGHGYCVLLGIAADDTEGDARWIINKLLKVRLFRHWNDNIEQASGSILLISQFTLYGKLKGNKLDFHLAMKSEPAEVLYESVLSGLRASLPERVQAGVFGGMMVVSIENDGPVTIEIDSRSR
ncbi:putative D-tyrosyl-tRNA deacylase [Protomyces lactucae-debilis]|uniref:D-aminoacyl-tRNA deacylase n=1 Tax=Protomyces lactucae-debilis TaxID=2754530 RepID=A0A1Y2FR13_PROLT|nr:putative D-tyrosyl-tRNA deacylase [Protomyces lactucae-debilis]ORY86418.1 putative D-tyrosyl-tRNA deacylase [Protomyces lactucae-debilis]